MSPPEIAHRAAEYAKRRSSRRQSYGWAGHGQGARVLSAIRESLGSNATEAFRQEARQAARDLLDGRFSALGVDWPKRAPDDLFPADVWRLDPVTGRHWPGGQFCFDLAYRHERILGDIKYVWEFNRLQHLQPLAVVFAIDGDRRCLEAIETAIDSWAAANPPYQGLGWNSGIETALRAVSLIVVDSLCSEGLSSSVRGKIADILEASLHWLGRFPSAFSSANNHLVAEALGEYMIAIALPQAPNAASVRVSARAILERESQKQILADGVPAEQSPTYGAFTAEMLLLALHVSVMDDQPLDQAVSDRLRQFADFIGWLALPDGQTPAIGDDDEGRVLTFCRPNHRYPAAIANAICAERGESAPAAALPGLDLPAGLFGTAPTEVQDHVGLKVFNDGGYSCVKQSIEGRQMALVVDHGPLGYLSIAAHGHADAAMLLLSLDGKPVLIDPGTYLYHSGAEWRDWFRGTRSHNTLAVEGQDQSVISGPFNWARKARAELVSHANQEAFYLDVMHDGYVQSLGVTHRRRVAAVEGGLEVTDRFQEGAPARSASLTWQFAPHLTLTGEGSHWQAFDAGRPVLRIELDASGQGRLHLGETGVEGGWSSPAFGEKAPAPRLCWEGAVSSQGVTTRLLWGPDQG